jgi:hypothetical protein
MFSLNINQRFRNLAANSGDLRRLVAVSGSKVCCDGCYDSGVCKECRRKGDNFFSLSMRSLCWGMLILIVEIGV